MLWDEIPYIQPLMLLHNKDASCEGTQLAVQRDQDAQKSRTPNPFLNSQKKEEKQQENEQTLEILNPPPQAQSAELTPHPHSPISSSASSRLESTWRESLFCRRERGRWKWRSVSPNSESASAPLLLFLHSRRWGLLAPLELRPSSASPAPAAPALPPPTTGEQAASRTVRRRPPPPELWTGAPPRQHEGLKDSPGLKPPTQDFPTQDFYSRSLS